MSQTEIAKLFDILLFVYFDMYFSQSWFIEVTWLMAQGLAFVKSLFLLVSTFIADLTFFMSTLI